MLLTTRRAAALLAALASGGLLAGCAGGPNSTPLGSVGQAASQTQASTAPMSCQAIDADSFHAVDVARPSAWPTPGSRQLYEPNAQNIATAYHNGANTMRADADRAPNNNVRDRARALADDFDTYANDMSAVVGLADDDNSADAAAKIAKLRQDNRKTHTDAKSLDMACDAN